MYHVNSFYALGVATDRVDDVFGMVVKLHTALVEMPNAFFATIFQ